MSSFGTSVFDNTKVFQPRSTPLALTFQRPAGTHEAFLDIGCSIFCRKPMKRCFGRSLGTLLCTKAAIAPRWNVLRVKSKRVALPLTFRTNLIYSLIVDNVRKN